MEYSKINKAINTYLEKWGVGRKIAIYPFGEMGVKTKEILNWRYGIKEAIIVDNQLAHVNPDVYLLEKVKDYEEYIWILTCENPIYHDEIRRLIQSLVPENQIIDVFGEMFIHEDVIYTSEYRLLSKLSLAEYKNISVPCKEFVELVEKKKHENRAITVAEVGVGAGATAVAVCKRLQKEDTYFCFDYEDIVEDLLHDLNEIPEICCTLMGEGNTYRTYDSYNWNLCKLLFQMRNNNLGGIFDVVYLDGAHTFFHDATACCLLKELLKPNGYIVFDDVLWTGRRSKAAYPELKDLYTEEQLCDCQVERVINAFMIEDEHFQQVYLTQSLNPYRAVYKKLK